MVSKVTHFAVFNVHPCLSHILLGPSTARLAVVGDDLRDGADVRSTIAFVFVWGIFRSVPREHLIRWAILHSEGTRRSELTEHTSRRYGRTHKGG